MRNSLHTRIMAVAAIILAASSLAVLRPTEAQGGSQAQASPPVPGDACSLLTKESAAAALGEAVSEPKAKAMADQPAGPGTTLSSCEYSGSGLHRVELDLTRLPPDAVPMYRAMCAEKGGEGLAGLGDVACWYNEKHEELHALKGAAFLSIELRRSGDPTEAIKSVMKKALDRLK